MRLPAKVAGMSVLTLYDYWRSSAAYRVRIALALKGLTFESIQVNLMPNVAEQLGEAYAAKNPQRRVPMLETEAGRLRQSLAIIEYLDEAYPEPPLMPADPWSRAQVRAFALTIACDIHPLNNTSTQARLRAQLAADDDQVLAWGRYWVETGLSSLEASLAWAPRTPFAFGETPTIADILLVPQMYNARRVNLDSTVWTRLTQIETVARAHPAFIAAAPENQPAAPKEPA
jgi:maleylpyruvate isomerase